nr:retrovirus-related Pol polyprotein from transposon TNT 1-94 [Tanacetum cinerariifolium]
MLTYRLSLSGNGDDVDQFSDSSIRQNTVSPQQGADTGGGNVMTHLFARRADLVDVTTVPISRIFDRLRHMCLDTRGLDYVNNLGNSYRQILHQNESTQRADKQLVSHTRAHVFETVSLHTQSDMLGHTPSSSLVAPLNHTYLCMDVTEHTIRPQIVSFSDGSLKDDSKPAPTRSLSPSLPFHAHLPPLTLWQRVDLVYATTVPVLRIFDRLRHMCLDTCSSDCVNNSGNSYHQILHQNENAHRANSNSYRQILHQNESAQRADRKLVSHTRVHISKRVSLHTQSDMLGHTPSSSLVASLNHTYLCMDVTERIVIPQIISFSDGSLKDDSKTAPTHDVDQFGDTSIRQNTVSPQQGADTRIFDRLRHMCLDTRGSDCVNNSDMLGHTPSSSLVAPLNHAYLCMDVTEHSIRPQIISFSDGSLKDGSKTAANQRSTFSSRTAGDSRARLVANSEESLVNPGVTTPPGFKRRCRDFYGDNAMDLMTASGRSRLKPAQEDSTWRRSKSQTGKPEEEEQDKDNLGNINTNPSSPPDPSISFITEKVCKLNLFFGSLGLVPQSSKTEFICSKGDESDMMFIEIIKKNDVSHKEESEVECSTSKSEDEEYAMAVRYFKKFFKRRGRFVRQPQNDKKKFQRSQDDKNGKRDRKCFRYRDPNHLIGECPKPPKDKNQRAFFGSSWSDSGEEDDGKVNNETCLVAQASSEVCSESSYFSDENSSIDDLVLYDKVEFDNEVQFGEFCNANGITHNFSAPRTPQSNGVVERKNMRLQEMSRTMLNEQSLPQKLWSKAVDTSTYILNRILIRAILGKELLRGRKPTLDYFKVFGSKCFILNTKDYLTKFDPKSYEGIFLSYSQNSKAYIILNKHTRKVKESFNVTFDETPPPSKTSPLVNDDLDEE